MHNIHALHTIRYNTYMTSHHITAHHITPHHITLHTLHTYITLHYIYYIHTCIHYIHTYITYYIHTHTYITCIHTTYITYIHKEGVMFMRNPPFLPTRFRPERVIKNQTPLEIHGSRSILEASSRVVDYLIKASAIGYHKNPTWRVDW